MMHRFQSLLIDMRVNLRRRNIRMPEHFLDDPQIGPVRQEVCRKRMSQEMRVNVDFKPGCCSDLFDNLPDPLGRQLFPVLRQEDFVPGFTSCQMDSFLRQIPVDRFASSPSNRHQPGLGTFTDYPDDSFLEI